MDFGFVFFGDVQVAPAENAVSSFPLLHDWKRGEEERVSASPRP